MELTDSGFDSSVLSEFRSRLIQGSSEDILFNILLEKCKERKWLKAKGRQRTDSTHVLGWVRTINRMVCVGETMRAALNTLAVVAPEWLQKNSQVDWVKPYGGKIEEHAVPKVKNKQEVYAKQVGIDGHFLLSSIYDQDEPSWLVNIPAVDTLGKVWLQQYMIEAGQIYWRTQKEGIPAAAYMISSPYDIQARYAKKNTTIWLAYKVHLRETCEENLPHLITNVVTTAGPLADADATQVVHEALQVKELLPSTHMVDSGYIDAKLLSVSGQDYEIDLLGASRQDYRWQAQAGKGFAAQDFKVDWQKQQAICPEGKLSSSWSTAKDTYGQETVKIKFAQKDCIACASWTNCTRAARGTISLRKQEHHFALLTARKREQSMDFKNEYSKRAGIRTTSLSLDPLRHHLSRCRSLWVKKS